MKTKEMRKLLTDFSGELMMDLGLDFDNEKEYINKFLSKRNKDKLKPDA